jgi:hypothetical protein
MLQISASQVARITGVSHQCPAKRAILKTLKVFSILAVKIIPFPKFDLCHF